MPTVFEHRLNDHLQQCRFVPGSFAKRFSASIAAKDQMLSPKQHLTLCNIVVRYRRQINKGIVEVAEREASYYGDEQRQAFEFHLDRHPCDWDARMVYADWLEERGDQHAETQRMFARDRIALELAPRNIVYHPDAVEMTDFSWTWVRAYWFDTRAEAERKIASRTYERTTMLSVIASPPSPDDQPGPGPPE